MKTSFLTRGSLLVTLIAIAACGSRPSPPGRLENVGGSSGGGPDASANGGTAGGGAGPALDAGGHEPDEHDAGDDPAPPDAGAEDAGADAGPSTEEGCVLDSLESECDGGAACPEVDEAADWLLDDDSSAVVRRACEGADGTRYVAIGATFDDSSTGYIYDAESGALVSKYGVRDAADYCAESTPSTVGFYGRVIAACASVNPNDTTTPCPDGSSGPGNGEEFPEECIYLND